MKDNMALFIYIAAILIGGMLVLPGVIALDAGNVGYLVPSFVAFALGIVGLRTNFLGEKVHADNHKTKFSTGLEEQS